MQEHRLVTLGTSIVLNEATAVTFNLDTATSLGLNVLDVGTLVTNDIRSKIEARNRLEIDRDLLLWPLSATTRVELMRRTLFTLDTAEAALVDQDRQILLHQLIDLFDGLLETLLGLASDVQVERGFLDHVSKVFSSHRW